jgi:hypothetical protein
LDELLKTTKTSRSLGFFLFLEEMIYRIGNHEHRLLQRKTADLQLHDVTQAELMLEFALVVQHEHGLGNNTTGDLVEHACCRAYSHLAVGVENEYPTRLHPQRVFDVLIIGASQVLRSNIGSDQSGGSTT